MKYIIFFVIILLAMNGAYSIPQPSAHQESTDQHISGESTENDIGQMISLVNETRLVSLMKDLLEYAPRYLGSRNCTLAAEYIYDFFKNLSLQVSYEAWAFPFIHGTNIVATLPGTDLYDDATIIICAHYDTSKQSPGAIDDGSGIVALMAIAQILNSHSFNHTVKFIAFSGEEAGAYGSFAYAKKAYASHENILAAFNLDMIGYTTYNGENVYISCAERSTWIFDLIQSVDEEFMELLNISVERLLEYPGDEESFRDLGYDGVLVIEESINDSIRVWNNKNDTLDKVDFGYITKITRLMLAATATLAEKYPDVQIRITTPRENEVYLGDKSLGALPGFNIRHPPLRGLTYIFGRSKVQVNITTKEEIDMIFFYIDDQRIGFCNTPPYECEIQSGYFPISKFLPLIGKHMLRVYVCTSQQHTAIDEMDIFVLKL